jgi:hypothetical protein
MIGSWFSSGPKGDRARVRYAGAPVDDTRIPNMTVEALPYDAMKKANYVEVGVYDDEKVLNTSLAATLLGVNSSQANGIVG